jgi:hypothetical protein
VDAHVSEPLGSAAEEAARLFGAAEEWLRSRSAHALDGMATGAPECSICPVCQAVSALRSVRPETVEHLLDAAASLVAALRSTATASAGHPSHPVRVQRIDVQEG